ALAVLFELHPIARRKLRGRLNDLRAAHRHRGLVLAAEERVTEVRDRQRVRLRDALDPGLLRDRGRDPELPLALGRTTEQSPDRLLDGVGTRDLSDRDEQLATEREPNLVSGRGRWRPGRGRRR